MVSRHFAITNYWERGGVVVLYAAIECNNWWKTGINTNKGDKSIKKPIEYHTRSSESCIELLSYLNYTKYLTILARGLAHSSVSNLQHSYYRNIKFFFQVTFFTNKCKNVYKIIIIKFTNNDVLINILHSGTVM